MEAQSDPYLLGALGQFFRFEGRVRRMTFWVNGLVFGMASLLLNLWCVHRYISSSDLQEHTYITHGTIYVVAMLLIGFRGLSISVRRWHDLGQSGWFAALNLIVFANSIEAIDLPDSLYWIGLLISAVVSFVILGFQGFVPGDQGTNQYGPPPEPGQLF